MRIVWQWIVVNWLNWWWDLPSLSYLYGSHNFIYMGVVRLESNWLKWIEMEMCLYWLLPILLAFMIPLRWWGLWYHQVRMNECVNIQMQMVWQVIFEVIVSIFSPCESLCCYEHFSTIKFRVDRIEWYDEFITLISHTFTFYS